jgi:hypothetical protein
MIQNTPQGTSPIDIDAALANPSACFAQPQDVLAYPGLSRVLQLKILSQWEQDARGLAEAESEGMGGGEESMLGRVRQAIRTLGHAQGVSRSNAVGGKAQTPIGAGRRIADSLQEAATQVQHVASRAQGGVTEIRTMIRARPLTAALVAFGSGYLFGRLALSGPDRDPNEQPVAPRRDRPR